VMHPRIARLLIRLHPRAWRDRYGAEFLALLESSPDDLPTLADTLRSAVRERLIPTQGGCMNSGALSFSGLVRRPSAFLPIAMSMAALALVLIHIAVYGAGRQPDEGAVAHLWQILMAGQAPVLLWFAFHAMRRAPRPALRVIALQTGAALASLAPVFLLRL
jgi:hypothetical protein